MGHGRVDYSDLNIGEPSIFYIVLRDAYKGSLNKPWVKTPEGLIQFKGGGI